MSRAQCISTLVDAEKVSLDHILRMMKGHPGTLLPIRMHATQQVFEIGVVVYRSAVAECRFIAAVINCR